jgi:hypothetical protein
MDWINQCPYFNGTVKIDSLSYQNLPVGTLAVEARNDNNEAVTFNGTLTGYGNNVDVKGNYNQEQDRCAGEPEPD